MTKITQASFKYAVRGTGGVYLDISKKLRVDRSTITKYLQRNPKMMEVINEEREKMVDVAENVFKEALNLDAKDKRLSHRHRRDFLKLKMKAADKVVSTLGKNRGWVTREEREHSGEINHNMEPIKINVIMPDDVKESKENDRKSKKDVKIAIAGIPNSGMKELSENISKEKKCDLFHTDETKGMEWSAGSEEVSKWFDKDQFIIEGVVVPRALRKWLKRNDGKPCDELIWMSKPLTKLTSGQESMAKGCLKVMKEIRIELKNRGVIITDNVKEREKKGKQVPCKEEDKEKGSAKKD